MKATTAVTLGMLGQFKEIMQILLSIAIYQEHMSVQTGVGLSVSILAANFYRLIKSGYFDTTTGGGGGTGGSNGTCVCLCVSVPLSLLYIHTLISLSHNLRFSWRLKLRGNGDEEE